MCQGNSGTHYGSDYLSALWPYSSLTTNECGLSHLIVPFESSDQQFGSVLSVLSGLSHQFRWFGLLDQVDYQFRWFELLDRVDCVIRSSDWGCWIGWFDLSDGLKWGIGLSSFSRNSEQFESSHCAILSVPWSYMGGVICVSRLSALIHCVR